MSLELLAISALVVALAATATGYTGFAFNLLSVPLLSFVMPVKHAVIVALVLGITVSLQVVVRNRGEVQWRALRPLALGIVPGVVLGTITFRWISEDVLRICVGALTVVLAIYLLTRKAPRVHTPHASIGAGVGMLGGTLSALTGMGGPPVVAYLAHVTEASSQVRATMAAAACAMGLTGLIGHGISGELTPDLLLVGLVLVPFAALGVLGGSIIFRHASRWYPVTVSIVLISVGGMGLAVPLLGNLA